MSQRAADGPDRVFIRGLVAHGVLGVDPEELLGAREVRLDLYLWLDARPAAASDDLFDAADYRAVADAVREHVAAGAPLLVERLAGELAELVLRGWPAVERVRVRVEKPGALPYADGVGVEIERSRAGLPTKGNGPRKDPRAV